MNSFRIVFNQLSLNSDVREADGDTGIQLYLMWSNENFMSDFKNKYTVYLRRFIILSI